MSARQKTVLGNALKWALLMPFVGVAVCLGLAFVFVSGYGLAAYFTDDMHIRSISGIVALAMGLGAWMGASTA